MSLMAACRIALIVFLVLSALALPAHADPGDLDPDFGTNGVVTTDLTNEQNFGIDLALQEDGKILFTGTTSSSGTRDFGLVRYNEDGTLDSSFGSNGIVITTIGMGIDQPGAIVLQPDDKIVVAGDSDAAGTFDVVLVRYESDGSLDAGFGSNGIASLLTPILIEFVRAMALQDDGKFVVAGIVSTGMSDERIFVTRLLPDGSLDTDFAGDGTADIQVDGKPTFGTSLAIQDDGKIIVAGSVFDGAPIAIALVRFNTDGSLDTDFGSAGEVSTSIGSVITSGDALTLQSDGKIIVAGQASSGAASDIALVRYNSDGSLDEDFDGDGVVTTPLGTFGVEPGAVAVQDDGRIVVAATNFDGPIDSDFAAARYHPDGSLDTSFGSGGTRTTSVGGNATVAALVIQPDGKLVLGGADGADLALLRYLGNRADMRIDKTVDDDAIKTGDTVVFTLEISNDGPDITGVHVTDTLPVQLDLNLASITPSQGSCEASAPLTCNLGAMDDGDTAEVSYSATATAKGITTNEATVTGQAIDLDSSNNTVSLTVTIDPSGGCSLIR